MEKYPVHSNHSPFTLPVAAVRKHGLKAPERAFPTDAGLDLRLDLTRGQAGVDLIKSGSPTNPVDIEDNARTRVLEGLELHLAPGARVWVDSGFAIALPRGFEGQVRGRSGLSLRHGIVVWHIGTIDPSYRGEVRIALGNDGQRTVVLRHGDRIAQLIIHAIPTTVDVVQLDQLQPAEERNEGGFGSSGTR